MSTQKNIVLILLALSVLLLSSCKKNSNSPATETFTLETTISPAEAGIVSPNGGAYDKGSQIELSATANEGWVFSEWNGDLAGSSNPATITINQNMSVNALFEQLTHPLTVDITGEGDVSEQIVNAKTDYAVGTTVELTANPAEHWEFVEWQGDLTSSENPETVTMDQAKTVTAIFEEIEYPLTITVEGEGDVSEEIVNGKTYTYGTMVEVMGNAASEWRFVEWTGDLETENNPATITMDGAKNINAVFEFGFDEDFEDGEAENWLFSDDRFSVEDGKLKFSTGNDGNFGAAFYNQVFTNFKVEAKVARIKSKETIDNTLAIYIHSKIDTEEQSLIDGYQVGITQNGFGSVFVIEGEDVTTASPWVGLSEINDNLGEYNIVTVNVVGSTFEFFINGKHIITLKDDTLTEGLVGIGTYAGEDGNNQVLWEYVKVTQADPLQTEKGKIGNTQYHPKTSQSSMKGVIPASLN